MIFADEQNVLIICERGFTDATVDGDGRALLRFCHQTGLMLCSGRLPGDTKAAPTLKARTGKQATRIDHVLTTVATLPLLHSSVKAKQEGSDQWPLAVVVDLQLARRSQHDQDCAGTVLSRVRDGKGCKRCWHGCCHSHAAR